MMTKISFKTAKQILLQMREGEKEEYKAVFAERFFGGCEGITKALLSFIQTYKWDTATATTDFNKDREADLKNFKKYLDKYRSEILDERVVEPIKQEIIEVKQQAFDKSPTASPIEYSGSLADAKEVVDNLNEHDKLLYLEAYRNYFLDKLGGTTALVKFVQAQSKADAEEMYQLNPREDLFLFRNFLPEYGRGRLLELQGHVNIDCRKSFMRTSEDAFKVYRDAYFNIKQTIQMFEDEFVKFINGQIEAEKLDMSDFNVEQFENYLRGKIIMDKDYSLADGRIDIGYYLQMTSNMPNEFFDKYVKIYEKRCGSDYLMHFTLAYFAGHLKEDNGIDFNYEIHIELFESFLQSPQFIEFISKRHQDKTEYEEKIKKDNEQEISKPLGMKTAEASGEDVEPRSSLVWAGQVDNAKDIISKITDDEKQLYIDAYKSIFSEEDGQGDQAFFKFVMKKQRQHGKEQYRLNPASDLSDFRSFLNEYVEQEKIEKKEELRKQADKEAMEIIEKVSKQVSEEKKASASNSASIDYEKIREIVKQEIKTALEEHKEQEADEAMKLMNNAAQRIVSDAIRAYLNK